MDGLPAHTEWMLVGWMTQFALGIAFWILPRLSGPAPRGREIWTQWTFILLNAGIWLVCFSSLTAQPRLMMLSRLLEVAAFITFGFGNWPRIRALSALREKSRPF
jgi:heme/copper-type cytochrome/quinol oxidase subunit 1